MKTIIEDNMEGDDEEKSVDKDLLRQIFNQLREKPDVIEMPLELILAKANNAEAKIVLEVNNEKVSTGDFCLVKPPNDRCAVARIEEITREKNLDSFIVSVKWYYDRIELARRGVITPSDFVSISEFEVFPVNCVSNIPEKWLFQKCSVSDLSEYETRSEVSDLDFYTRAHCDIFLRKIHPPLRKWTKVCFCDIPYNPLEDYTKCSQCEKLIHLRCAGVRKELLHIIKSFRCNRCAAAKPNNL